MIEAASANDDREHSEIVAFLRNPAAWPGEPGPIDVVETHFAWVFLGARHVYKLKKPIRFHAVDFSSLEKRRLACETEVTLNRRLARDVYIAAVPLTLSGERFVLEGAGPAVDWLVKMHRLDPARALDRLAVLRAVNAADIDRLIRKLARFHSQATFVDWTAAEYRARLAGTVEDWCAGIGSTLAGHVARDLERLEQSLLGFIARETALIDARVEGRHVVDGHGDLRPEHVFLTAEPQIIDCIEFSAELRLLDRVEEVAFLDLECERLGERALGQALADAYFTESADRPDAKLYGFYRARRALGRALICSWRLSETLAPADAARWQSALEWYLRAALDALASART